MSINSAVVIHKRADVWDASVMAHSSIAIKWKQSACNASTCPTSNQLQSHISVQQRHVINFWVRRSGGRTDGRATLTLRYMRRAGSFNGERRKLSVAHAQRVCVTWLIFLSGWQHDSRWQMMNLESIFLSVFQSPSSPHLSDYVSIISCHLPPADRR